MRFALGMQKNRLGCRARKIILKPVSRPRQFLDVTGQILRLKLEISTSPLDRVIHEVDAFLFENMQNLATAIIAHQFRQVLIGPAIEHPFDHETMTFLPVHFFIDDIPK